MPCGKSGTKKHASRRTLKILPLAATETKMESETQAKGQSAAMTCSASEWWAKHSALLAEKMAIGGVRSFRVDHIEGKRFSFEVVPMNEEPNDGLASRLASALWECSTLRHGMFTPPEFRKICERVISDFLSQNA